MMALGVAELLLLVVLGGNTPGDLVSMIHADDYFQSCKIDLTVEKMAELAGKEPVSGQAQIQQLLALRLLGEDASEVKRSDQHQAVLDLVRQIAAGKKAQDRFGFAKDYAAQTLARLEGKEAAPTVLPKDSLRAEAFRWFPAAATFIAGLDFRGGHAGDELAQLRKVISAKMPPPQKEFLYGLAESLGNIRIERTSFAFVEDVPAGEQKRVYVRITGKADPARLVEVLEKQAGMTVVNKDNVFILQRGNMPPAMAIVGDSDFLMAGYETDGDNAKLLDEMLALRGKEEGNALSGKWKGDLARLPVGVNGLLIGRLPADLLLQLGTGALDKLVATLKRDKGIQVRFEGVFSSAEQAEAARKDYLAMRDQGLAMLRSRPQQPKEAVKVLENMRKTLESLRLEVQGKSVQGSLRIDGNPAELLQALMIHETSTVPEPPPAIDPKQQR